MLDPQELLIIVLVAVIVGGASFVQSLIGFGFAIVALSLFSFVLDMREANVIVTLSFLVPVIAGVWAHRHDLLLVPLLICLVGSIIGLPVGLYVFAAIDEVWLIRLTGLMILTLAIHGLVTSKSAGSGASFSWLWTLLTGAASGLLAGAVGMGGPPVAAYATRQTWQPRQIKAFLLAFLLLLGVMRAVGLVTVGSVDQQSLLYSGIALPFALIGGFLGLRTSHNMDAVLFRRITMCALVVLSLGMIFRR